MKRFEMPNETWESLERLQKKAGLSSVAETIRHALASYDCLWDHQLRENIIVIKTPEGEFELKLKN